MRRIEWILWPLALLAVSGLSLGIGSVRIPVAEFTRFALDGGGDMPEVWRTIVLNLRLPRILAAGMVGGVLSVGGVACQGIFRNPLSEPYLLGISSGAALGAAIAIVASPPGSGAGLGLVAVSAFIGAMGITMAVFVAAGRGAFRMPSTLLLSGIAVAFLCQAVIWLLMTLNRDQVARITFWTLGSLAAADWTKVAWLAVTTLPVTVALGLLGRVMDVLSTGHDSAHGLGLRPGRAAALVLGLTALGTAAAVAVAGSIGFIGLMVPHLVRISAGPSHRSLVARTWFGGAMLLMVADLAARTVNAPGEIPVGVLTALVGAPFLLILARGKRGEGRLDG